ncbi:MAG TPA: flavohemoglobin expression-modulating QEGLA motif protein [Bdellovibrionales bacterium]|nr:flavohemoglobin expression-modulating QEGLA motif protein [Bdellovibrionales bacterium]
MWVTYKEKLKALSDRIVEAQKPIRVLDSVKWESWVEDDFFEHKAKRLPKVDPEFYGRIPIGFDPKQKAEELEEICRDVDRTLGEGDDLGAILKSMAGEYAQLARMLAARGTPQFYEYSKRLYGSPKDRFYDEQITIRDQGHQLYGLLATLENKFLGQEYPKILSSDQVVLELQERFRKSFLKGLIDVRMSDGIVADASAGNDVIKIREGAMFSKKDIDIFEVHEGWVHVATTLNGKSQKVARFLSKGSPRCVATQEGLAILMEILTFSTYPLRARAINDRILGVDKAEEGANFLEVYEFYQTEGYSEQDSFRNSMRVFRGGDVGGRYPFTKDISYCRGFIENYNFIRTAIRKGRPEIVPFMFAGKLNVSDVPLLYQKSLEGIIDPPALLPPQFEDLNGLAVWMSFSNFLNVVDMHKVSEYYDGLFAKYL